MSDATVHPATKRRRSGRGSLDADAPRERRSRRRLVRVASPFPAVEGVPAQPPWYVRLRGVIGASVLVTFLGVLTAVAVAVLLALVVVVVVSTVT